MVQAVMAGERFESRKYEHDGRSYFGTYSILESNGWGVVLGISMSRLLAKSRTLTLRLLLLNTALFAVALFVTLTFTRQITAGQKQAEEDLKASLKEKEILMQEIHHRVKNNMQIISSLMKLQSRKFRDNRLKEVFRECHGRIQAMALVHETLYQSDSLSEIDLRQYVERLANHLFQAYKARSKIQLKLGIEDIIFEIEQAIPCGLIVNELLSNSLKHAFPGGRKGNIEIRAHLTENGEIELAVSDNGVGLPDGFDLHNTETLGLELVAGLVESQLEGTVSINMEKGTEFVMHFNKKS
ncbi:hypothetical protein ES703_85069 [subsurface metagenome]